MKIFILVSIVCVSITGLALGQVNKKSDDDTTKTINEDATPDKSLNLAEKIMWFYVKAFAGSKAVRPAG